MHKTRTQCAACNRRQRVPLSDPGLYTVPASRVMEQITQASRTAAMDWWTNPVPIRRGQTSDISYQTPQPPQRSGLEHVGAASAPAKVAMASAVPMVHGERMVSTAQVGDIDAIKNRLGRLKELLDEGVLTPDEYRDKRAETVARI